jgi:hypothetical protein
MLLMRKRAKLLFQQKFEVPLWQSKVPKFFNIENKREGKFDISNALFEVGEITLPFFEDPSHILKFSSNDLGCISDVGWCSPTSLNNTQKIRMLHPEVFKLKPTPFGD